LLGLVAALAGDDEKISREIGEHDPSSRNNITARTTALVNVSLIRFC
jgi:hypothetical protein